LDSGIVCIVTFGVEPPDNMLIAIRAPLGGFQELRLTVERNGAQTAYPCQASADFPNEFSCTGPIIPLGSTLRINVLAGPAGTLLASGEFRLTAMALPTVAVGTPPALGTAYPNP
jgi:hypothetical protein